MMEAKFSLKAKELVQTEKVISIASVSLRIYELRPDYRHAQKVW